MLVSSTFLEHRQLLLQRDFPGFLLAGHPAGGDVLRDDQDAADLAGDRPPGQNFNAAIASRSIGTDELVLRGADGLARQRIADGPPSIRRRFPETS